MPMANCAICLNMSLTLPEIPCPTSRLPQLQQTRSCKTAARQGKAAHGRLRVGNIGKFLCIGLNYSDHAAETGAAIPEHPILFMKATSAVVGANDTMLSCRAIRNHPIGKSNWAS